MSPRLCLAAPAERDAQLPDRLGLACLVRIEHQTELFDTGDKNWRRQQETAWHVVAAGGKIEAQLGFRTSQGRNIAQRSSCIAEAARISAARKSRRPHGSS